MSYSLAITNGAVKDMQRAYDYYEQQQAGLGDRFISALEARFATLSEHPEYYSYIDDKQMLRDVSVEHFPYVVIYRITNEHVRIYAVHPTHQPLKDYAHD